MLRVKIQNDERGLLFKDGNYMKCLQPGKYFYNPFVKYSVVKADVNQPFDGAGKNINLFLEDEELGKELTILDVQDYEIAIHFEDGKLVDVLTAGKYAFWNVLKKHEFIMVDKRNPEIDPKIDLSVYSHPLMFEHVTHFHVLSHEQGILYFDNVVQKILEPGIYSFWRSPIQVTVQKIDLRQQQIDMTGQEMMTADKVSMRLNFVCHYRITDPLKVMQIKSFEEQIYIALQLILREYVGIMKLDDLLLKKQEVGQYVLQKLQEKNNEYGVEFIFAGVKDVILPGDMKEILNTVLIAEKQAQANVITRREETASTRSLLNTAKLMEENQTLYRLKELEFLEKICEKIGNISLTGENNLLEQLNQLVARNTNHK
ncbi:SPFH domain / Band 7 family protein [Seinonella peptonophila]|uniref:SPFH domain / Band 7 family protein n=1 Tax=Seinonella peptonophila TaxID=112248 RepID=A0A1M4YS05_9BACL|nr:slipin family protein [Seinonella peptonophila]SHF08116.1 SPFH domain / Band 7 family protein [Seinonella peptonophila]